MQTVTAKDIAERIKRPDEDLQAAVDRLKNWTREGLLKTVGEKNPGRGRARQFSERTMVDAVLLQILTDAIGMAAAAAAPYLEDMRGEIADAQKHMRKPGAESFFLVIARSIGGAEWQLGCTPLSKLEMSLRKRGSDTYTIIDLERMFARLDAGEK